MGYPLFLYLFLHLVFFLDRGTRYSDTPTMNDPYIKLIKQKERESKDGFKRAREIVKAFAKHIKFPSEKEISKYRTPRNNRLDAVLEYLTDTYISKEQLEHQKRIKENERYEKR